MMPLSKYGRSYLARRYAIFFYSLLFMLAAEPLLNIYGRKPSLFDVLLAVSLVAAVAPIGAISSRRWLQPIVVVLALIAAGAICLDGLGLSTSALILWSLLAFLGVVSSAHFTFRATVIDREHIYAALSTYLLAGVFLGVLYGRIELHWPGSFVDSGARPGEVLTNFNAIYFSFVTLATLGYGDIVPHGRLARGLAAFEAVSGQIYLAVLMARLVSLYVSRPRASSR